MKKACVLSDVVHTSAQNKSAIKKDLMEKIEEHRKGRDNLCG